LRYYAFDTVCLSRLLCCVSGGFLAPATPPLQQPRFVIVFICDKTLCSFLVCTYTDKSSPGTIVWGTNVWGGMLMGNLLSTPCKNCGETFVWRHFSPTFYLAIYSSLCYFQTNIKIKKTKHTVIITP